MGSVEMCFKGSCDVTNEAERLSMVRLPKEEDGGVGWGGCNQRWVGGLGVRVQAEG